MIAQQPLVAGAVPATADPNGLVVGLEETVASLRTWLALVSALALIALGVAVYAALNQNNSPQTQRGVAGDERVSRLNSRVDRLSGQVKGLRAGTASSGASASTTAALSARVDALSQSVKSLSGRTASGGDPTQALSRLSGRIDALSQQVSQIKQGQPQTQTQTTP